jgi:hypothetical protein
LSSIIFLFIRADDAAQSHVTCTFCKYYMRFVGPVIGVQHQQPGRIIVRGSCCLNLGSLTLGPSYNCPQTYAGAAVRLAKFAGHVACFIVRFLQTCKNLVDTAFNACATGIHKAQDQCLSVMGALGTVYHHARDVLDRINPDRWSPKQQQQQQQQQQNIPMKKRQVILGDGRY